MQPLVSIITPTYNHEQFIAACIESVLAQTYEHWEMIIVDDGSTDNTWEIIQKYSIQDTRISAFRQQNKGIWQLADTYNFAFNKTQGEFIAVLEGDDLWLENKLEDQLNLHINNSKNIIFSYGLTEIISNRELSLGIIKPHIQPGYYNSMEFLREMLMRQTGIIPVSCLISATHLREIGGFCTESLSPIPFLMENKLYPAVDYPTFTKLFLETEGIVIYNDKILGRWRKHTGQTTDIHEISIAEGMYQVANKRLFLAQKKFNEDSKISYKDFFEAHRIYLIGTYLKLFRNALIRKDSIGAKNISIRLWYFGKFRHKVQVFYGLILSRFDLNLEHLFAIYNRDYPDL